MLTRDALDRLLSEILPPYRQFALVLEDLAPGRCVLRLPATPAALRPGGTISGPAMFAAADIAFYGAVLARVPDPVGCVTVSLELRFLRRPPPTDLWVTAQLLAITDGLAHGRVELRAAPEGAVLALAQGVYTAPPGAAQA